MLSNSHTLLFYKDKLVPDTADTLFFFQLSKLQRDYSKSLTMRLETYDVRPGYLAILHRLWKKDNITQKELNTLIEIEQATLSNTLSRMERDGQIGRASCRERV